MSETIPESLGTVAPERALRRYDVKESPESDVDVNGKMSLTAVEPVVLPSADSDNVWDMTVVVTPDTPVTSGPPAKRRRVELSLADKVSLIRTYEELPNITYTQLARDFCVGRSTVSDILKKKQLYLDQHEKNANGEMRRFNYICKFKPVNETMWRWYEQARLDGVYINGPRLKEKALEIAAELNFTDFKASNGWLDSWLRRFSVGLVKHGTRDKAVEYVTETEVKVLPAMVCAGEGASAHPTSCYPRKEDLPLEPCADKQDLEGLDCGQKDDVQENITVANSSPMNGEQRHQNLAQSGVPNRGTSRRKMKIPKSTRVPAQDDSESELDGYLYSQDGANMTYYEVLNSLTRLKNFALANDHWYLSPIQTMISMTLQNILRDKPATKATRTDS